jgi:hypothetical protein
MNWDAIGAVSEGLGALAVFITLAYLAVQVRQTREDVRRSISQARAEAQRQVHAAYRDPRVNAALIRAMDTERELRGEEPIAGFTQYAAERWGISREDAFLLFSVNIEAWEARLMVIPHADQLSALERHHFDAMIRGLYGEGSRSSARAFYELYIKPTQHPDAVAYVERVLASGS